MHTYSYMQYKLIRFSFTIFGLNWSAERHKNKKKIIKKIVLKCTHNELNNVIKSRKAERAQREHIYKQRRHTGVYVAQMCVLIVWASVSKH